MSESLPTRIRLVIFDLDGVVYRGPDPIPGAADLIARLRDGGAAVTFATNNSTATRTEYADRLAGMGIAARPAEVMTSNRATIVHLQRALPSVRRILPVGAPSMAEEFTAAGFDIASTPAGGDGTSGGVDAVVVGLDRSFDYDRLTRAADAIRAGALFIATNADARYPIPGGFLPGAGAMVAAVAATSLREPLVVGKPEPAMFKAILAETGVEPGEAVVIGDNPDADMPAAHRAGLASVLVLTGVATAADVPGLIGEREPTAVAPGPAEVWSLLSGRLSS